MSSQELGKRYSRVLMQKGQTNLVSEPFYVGDRKVAVSAYAAGTGLPPGARITFQELIYIDGGRTDGTLCTPGQMNGSQLCDYKPLVSCGCEPTLTERNSYIQLDRGGWFRAVYVGPARASVMVVAQELAVGANTGCCVSACCPIEVDLVIDKSVSSEVITSGDDGSFTIVLSNLGPDASRGGFLTDVLPTGLTYGIPSAVYAGGAQGTQPALAQLAAGDWHYTALPPGGTITVTIPFTATSPGSYIPKTNTASVHPGIDEIDTNWVNNTDTVFYVIAKPVVDVWILKSTVAERIKTGDTFTYTLTSGNSGPRDASGSIIKDDIPAGLPVTSIVAVYSGGAAGPQPTEAQLAAGYVVPVFPAGGQVVITVTGVATTTGYYLNSAFVKAPSSVEDSNLDNNTASTPLTIVKPVAEVSVAKAVADSTLKEGDTFQYTIVVTNAGPDSADGTVATDVLPEGLVVASLTATYAGGASGSAPTVAELAVGHAIAVLPAGGSVTYTVVGTAPDAGFYVNTTSIKVPASIEDPDLSNNQDLATLQVVVRTVDLFVNKTANQQSYAIGEAVVYTVAFGNAGPDDANNAVLQDIIPSNLSPVTVGVTYSGGAAGPAPTPAVLAAGWVIPTLPAGGGGILTITGTSTSAEVITNAASIAPPPGRVETNPSDNTDIVVVTIRPNPYYTCDGELTSDDTLFHVGSLRKCVNGLVAPLDCGDILKVVDESCQECETDHWVTTLNGAGVCTVAFAGSYNPFTGTAVGSFADFSSPWGQVNFQGDNPPSRLVFSYTNPHACPVLVEAELTGHTNIFAIAGYTAGTIGAAYQLSENPSEPLENSFQNFAGGFRPNQMRHTFKLQGPTGYGNSGQYHEETVDGARYYKVLQPGQSITLYTTAWIILFQNDPIAQGVVSHLHQTMEINITKNGALL